MTVTLSLKHNFSLHRLENWGENGGIIKYRQNSAILGYSFRRLYDEK